MGKDPMKKRQPWQFPPKEAHFSIRRFNKLQRKVRDRYARLVKEGRMDEKDFPTQEAIINEARKLMS